MGYYCSCPCPVSFSRNVLNTPERCWVKLCLPWHLASGSSLPMAGTCHARPFQANQAWTQCSLAWVQFTFQWQMNIQGHSLFWLFWLLLYCHLWAYIDLHSSLLILVHVNLWCQLDPHNWGSERPGHSLSWQALVNEVSAVTQTMTYPGGRHFDSTPKVLPSQWARLRFLSNAVVL